MKVGDIVELHSNKGYIENDVIINGFLYYITEERNLFDVEPELGTNRHYDVEDDNYWIQERNIMNEIKEFDAVLLNVDLPHYNLQKDQIGTVVAVFSKGTAFEVVFSDENGRDIESLGLRLEQIRKK